VYCDSCPRAFHFMCLNPPLNPEDVGDGDWFCPACAPPPVRLFSRLIGVVQMTPLTMSRLGIDRSKPQFAARPINTACSDVRSGGVPTSGGRSWLLQRW
jgi:hypothetical protein